MTCLRKVKSGDPLKISGGTFNTFVDSPREYMWVRYADAGRFAVLGIDLPIFSPSEAADGFAN